jgi:hypothetical protein
MTDYRKLFEAIGQIQSRPVVQPEPESVKEIYWRLKAERLERELADRTSAPAYFWLGREADAA